MAPDPVVPTPALADLTGLKSGWKTSEFWITLLAYVVGCVLLSRNQDTAAAVLMSVATGGYHGARAVAKATAPTPS